MKNCSLAIVLLLSLAFAQATAAKNNSSKNATPRLILTIVVDQFRADELLRWKSQFQKGGYREFLDHGAVFPFAHYTTLQNMTCPGHAMILTGSLPAKNGIPLNEWFNTQTKKSVYCAEDAEFGLSPRSLQGSTLGDEMKLHWPTSKVIGVSLKDRASIMLAGRGANAAYWLDGETLNWTTSGYYKNVLPTFKTWRPTGAPKRDDMLLWKNTLGSRAFEHKVKWGTGAGFTHPESMKQTLQMAEAVVDAYGLGQKDTPDLLAVSFSTHDLAGHQFGPDSPEVEDMTLQEDHVIAEFFHALDRKIPGGMKNVWVLFTADHGVAPLVETAKELGLDAGRIDSAAVMKELNQQIRERFGSCRNGEWLLSVHSFHFYWDPDCILSARGQKKDVERFAKDHLTTLPGVAAVFTRWDYENGHLPPTFENEINRSFVPGISGELVLIPKAFWYEDGHPATHMTSYTYDRTVPLILMGTPFKPGVYAGGAQVIDAAPTLAHALRILAPALNEGRVLQECLMPEKL